MLNVPRDWIGNFFTVFEGDKQKVDIYHFYCSLKEKNQTTKTTLNFQTLIKGLQVKVIWCLDIISEQSALLSSQNLYEFFFLIFQF